MIQKWKDALELLGIDFREDLGIVETLCTAAERLMWQSQGLHNDQLSKCQPRRNWDLFKLHGLSIGSYFEKLQAWKMASFWTTDLASHSSLIHRAQRFNFF